MTGFCGKARDIFSSTGRGRMRILFSEHGNRSDFRKLAGILLMILKPAVSRPPPHNLHPPARCPADHASARTSPAPRPVPPQPRVRILRGRAAVPRQGPEIPRVGGGRVADVREHGPPQGLRLRSGHQRRGGPVAATAAQVLPSGGTAGGDPARPTSRRPRTNAWAR